jgi:hypothetical protein
LVLWLAVAPAACAKEGVREIEAEQDDSRDYPEPEDAPAAAPDDDPEPAEPVANNQGAEGEAAPKPAQAEAQAPSASPTRAASEPKVEGAKQAPSEPVAETAPAAAQPCGDKGQPSCPLQGWMERNLDAPLERGELAAVAAALRKLAGFAPQPDWNQGDNGWQALATRGADAAAAGDGKAVEQSCKGCHRAFRKKYKAEHRMRPVP